MDIYGKYRAGLLLVQNRLADGIEAFNAEEKIFEHVLYRLKSDESMAEKLSRKRYPVTADSAVSLVRDAVGFRIVCRFIDDIYENIERIRKLPGVTVGTEKDYVKNVKPNGYRSYHMILDVAVPEDTVRGHYFAEVQLRTIAMDSWAALEHEMKYKHTVENAELIGRELKRCADELASCDVSMQTIRNLIKGNKV
jgi:putative GTP pyrophosphokinase